MRRLFENRPTPFVQPTHVHILKSGLLSGHYGWFFWENDVDLGRKAKGIHINQLLMRSEAPCCGGGPSGNCLLIIHFIF